MSRKKPKKNKRKAARPAPAKVKTPSQPIPDIRMALMHHQAGRLQQAGQIYRQILAVDPGHADANHLLGMLAYGAGDYEMAAGLVGKAVQARPDFAQAHGNLGNILKELRRTEEAEASYRRALELKPDYPEAYNNLGTLLQELGHAAEAEASYRKALEQQPDFPEAYNNLGNVLKILGRPEEAEAAYREALRLRPGYAEAHSNLILGMNYPAGVSARAMLAEAREWDRLHGAGRVRHPRVCHNVPDPERRLRIGYVSPDFRMHPVGYFSEPLIASHDRTAVEVFCYADLVQGDQITERMRASAHHWRTVKGWSDTRLADRIQHDRIDILVDLAGHTAGNRLRVFAQKPAPVQITWLGYPGTTGLSAMDYRITDTIADPEAEADAQYSEKLVRLPNGFLCFRPPEHAPEVAPPPFREAGHITFGCFNNQIKFSGPTLGAWARLLNQVPDSRLLLRDKAFVDAAVCDRIFTAFKKHGVPEEKIELEKQVSYSKYLAGYKRVDICLDPFPFNGCTVTHEALWMGVPVVTLTAERFTHRMGASLLEWVGLSDLVADTRQAYVEIAARLAADPHRLAGLRRTLRSRLAASPLMDLQGFARDTEAAYRAMWRHWCSGNR